MEGLARNGLVSVTPDPGADSRMVTIRRVMEPGGREPKVTITLKGDSPDKDRVLMTLVNGAAAAPLVRVVSSGSLEKYTLDEDVRAVLDNWDVPAFLLTPSISSCQETPATRAGPSASSPSGQAAQPALRHSSFEQVVRRSFSHEWIPPEIIGDIDDVSMDFEPQCRSPSSSIDVGCWYGSCTRGL